MSQISSNPQNISADRSWFLADLQPWAKGFSFFEWNAPAVFFVRLTSERVILNNANEDIRAPRSDTHSLILTEWEVIRPALSSSRSKYFASHEIMFRALLTDAIRWVNCAEMYLLQQRKFSTRDENASCSCSLLFLGFLARSYLKTSLQTIGCLTLNGKA